MTDLPPGLLLLLGPVLAVLLRERALAWSMIALSVLSFWHLLQFPTDFAVSYDFAGLELTPVRVDRLSLVWGYVFHLAALLNAIYSWHNEDRVQHGAASAYAGSAICAVFCGDLLSLFVYWELTTLTSVFLIWATRTPAAERSAMRYLVVQIGSGVLLLAGILLRYATLRSVTFTYIGTEDLAGWLILGAFGIKCAFPLLHNWLQDAYPNATVTGAVVLSAFTTKLAVYALARGFAGTEILVPIGCVMALFPVFILENDLRRALAYSINNQLGFMVVGIGVGTDLAINGVAAHAFTHIIYKALLFMAVGAVLYRTGTSKASELGGLYKSMPLTAAACIIGGLSISGFPLFSGFVSKSMTLSAVADAHWLWITVGLMVAAVGVVDHSGIKISFFAFFAHDTAAAHGPARRVKEAPLNMLIAMGLAAAVCIGLGIYPQPLYDVLPRPVDYVPYTASHVITSLQLLLSGVLVFTVLWRLGWYPKEIPATHLDTDWVYRRAIPQLFAPILRFCRYTGNVCAEFWELCVARGSARLRVLATPPHSALGEPVSSGAAVLWALMFLSILLLALYN